MKIIFLIVGGHSKSQKGWMSLHSLLRELVKPISHHAPFIISQSFSLSANGHVSSFPPMKSFSIFLSITGKQKVQFWGFVFVLFCLDKMGHVISCMYACAFAWCWAKFLVPARVSQLKGDCMYVCMVVSSIFPLLLYF
jgi:hypothetical protein